MSGSIKLDKKIIALQNAVQSLKDNRDDLLKELEIVKIRTEQKQAI